MYKTKPIYVSAEMILVSVSCFFRFFQKSSILWFNEVVKFDVKNVCLLLKTNLAKYGASDNDTLQMTSHG